MRMQFDAAAKGGGQFHEGCGIVVITGSSSSSLLAIVMASILLVRYVLQRLFGSANRIIFAVGNLLFYHHHQIIGRVIGHGLR